MSKLGHILITIFVILMLFFGLTPGGRARWNIWFFDVQVADDHTSYETIRKVEDTARGMISSYEADKLKYQQYIASEDPMKKEWGEQAKMRANNTASSYNNYILKNKFVWRENIPADIKSELAYLE